jgi:hypothetical protein
MNALKALAAGLALIAAELVLLVAVALLWATRNEMLIW